MSDHIPNRPADDRTLDEILSDLEKVASGLIQVTWNEHERAKAAILRWHTAEMRTVLGRLRIQATVNTFNEDDSSEEYDYISVPIEAINTELNKLGETQ